MIGPNFTCCNWTCGLARVQQTTTCTCLLLLQDINPSKSRQTCFDSQRGGRSVSSTKLYPMYYLISFHGNGDVKKKQKYLGKFTDEPRNLPTRNQRRCVLQCPPLIYSTKKIERLPIVIPFLSKAKVQKVGLHHILSSSLSGK